MNPEARGVIAIIFLTSVLTLLPLLFGHFSTTQKNLVFNGFEFPEDSQAYAGYVQSGVVGNGLLLKNNSTSEMQDARYIILYFSLMAWVQKIVSVPLDILWNAFRVASIAFFLFSGWVLSQRLFSSSAQRLTSVFLLGMGGGLGGIIYLLTPIFPVLSRIYSSDLTYPIGY